MLNDTLLLTVNDLCQSVLPLGTTVIAGSDALDAIVRWVAVITPDSTLATLEGHDALLLTPGAIEGDALIHRAIESGAAVLITLEPLPTLALSTAQMLHLPVLQLPVGASLREVEHGLLKRFLDQEGSAERRSIQIYQQLVQLASENSGLERIIHELARLIDKAVIVHDKRLRVQESAIAPRLIEGWDDLLETLSSPDLLPSAFQDRRRLPLQTTPTLLHPIPGTHLSRLITPIVTGGVGRGYLAFVAPTVDFTETDNLVNRHAAVICALEMARAKAISEIEKRLRGDFLDGLVLGSLTETEAMAEGDRFGHDMATPHVALVVTWQGDRHPSYRRLETVVNGLSSHRVQSLFARLHDDELRLFYAIDSASPIPVARQFAEEIQDAAHKEYPDTRVAIGIGSPAARVSGWRASYREAAQAADLSKRLKADGPLYIGDMGIYTFLAHPDYRADLLALRDSTIGSLIAYEERQRADLLQTLEAFFKAHGNHTQTAELLTVHRNTLTYRMNRIAEITGLDLNQPDVRLAVHLALKIHRLLGS
jgi:purine catabolism regulator